MILIRKAKDEDLPIIQKLAKETWPTAYGDILSNKQISYMLDTMYDEGELLKQLQQGHTFLIASELSEDVGFAGFSLVDVETRTYKLHKIYVLPQVQGKGVGKLLTIEVLDEIKTKGGKLLQLNVNRANKAVGFYEKAGFAVKETVDVSIGNGFFMNDYVMEKEV